MRKVIAKIDLKNIRRNAEAFAALTGKPVCAVVKANAYGHGAEEVVNAIEGVVGCFAVSLLDEALALRVAACGKDVLILTPPSGEAEILTAAKHGFILTAGDLSTVKTIAGAGEKHGVSVRVHLKANTGMNRYGMDIRTLGKACKYLAGQTCVSVEGLYSHICEYTLQNAERQRKSFVQMQRVAKGYFPKLICHLSATYGALLGKEFAFDMTRIGIGLYGYLPDGAADIDESVLRSLSLQKGMTVWASVSASRSFRFGGAGYGAPVTAMKKGEPLTVLRFGYADGFLRKSGNGVCGFERNANNLCMDACIQRRKEKSGRWLPVMTDAGETARAAGTISYEVLCAATRRAEMVYDDETAVCGNGKRKRKER